MSLKLLCYGNDPRDVVEENNTNLSINVSFGARHQLILVVS
jgi:hypothetical protein